MALECLDCVCRRGIESVHRFGNENWRKLCGVPVWPCFEFLTKISTALLRMHPRGTNQILFLFGLSAMSAVVFPLCRFLVCEL
jgi:hypothetical protein